jgi:hypothetical protein
MAGGHQVSDERRNGAAPSTADPKPIRLPDWIKEAARWHEATVRFADALEKEDGQMTDELRRVRGLRKLMADILGRVEAP